MKKFAYLMAALVLFDVALLGVNKYNDWRAAKPTVVVSEKAVSAPVRAEQKTYRVSVGINPVVQSTKQQ
ncbi:MAG: hypothetical protein Q7R93_05170 [bacterium]|nr:hypothetical protein [bacterium]